MKYRYTNEETRFGMVLEFENDSDAIAHGEKLVESIQLPIAVEKESWMPIKELRFLID